MTNTTHGHSHNSGKSKHAEEFAGVTNDNPFDLIVEEGQDPDNYVNGVRYEFSIAPAEQKEDSMVGERYKRMHDAWRIHLATMLGGVAHWDLVTECSTPKHGRYLSRQLNRIHFHGYITFSDYAEFIMERAHFLTMICTFKISNLREQIWSDYISKQKYLMEPKLKLLYRLQSGPLPLCIADKGPLPIGVKAPRAAKKTSDRIAGVYNPDSVVHLKWKN